MLKTFKYFTTILAISFLLTACSQKRVIEKPTILEAKQDTIIELSKVEKAVWKKEDKFEKFMDKFLSEVISKVVMSFSSSLKAI